MKVLPISQNIQPSKSSKAEGNISEPVVETEEMLLTEKPADEFAKPSQPTQKSNVKDILLGSGIIASLAVAGVALYKNRDFKKEIGAVKDKLKEAEKKAEELKTKLKETEEKVAKTKETKKSVPVSQPKMQNADVTGLKNQNNILTNENNLLRSQIEELKNNLQEKTTGFLEKVKKVFAKNTNKKVQTAQAVKSPKKTVKPEEKVLDFNNLTKKEQKQVIAELKKLLKEKLEIMQKKAKEPVNIKEQHVITQPAKVQGTKINIRELKQNNPEYTFKKEFGFGKKLIKRIKTKYYELVADYRLRKAQKELQAENKRQDLQYKAAVQASDLRNEQWLEQQHKIKEQEYNEIFKDIPEQPDIIKKFKNKIKSSMNKFKTWLVEE